MSIPASSSVRDFRLRRVADTKTQIVTLHFWHDHNIDCPFLQSSSYYLLTNESLYNYTKTMGLFLAIGMVFQIQNKIRLPKTQNLRYNILIFLKTGFSPSEKKATWITNFQMKTFLEFNFLWAFSTNESISRQIFISTPPENIRKFLTLSEGMKWKFNVKWVKNDQTKL